MTNQKPIIDAPLGEFTFPTTDGNDITIGQSKSRWTMLFVYRGAHCPRCKQFLAKLNSALESWQAVLDVVVVSADSAEKATASKSEGGWNFDLCHSLSETQMRALNLYVSEPLSEAETTNLFAEPATFAIRPDGTVFLVNISNSPAARPDLDDLLSGIKYNIDGNRPARGTA